VLYEQERDMKALFVGQRVRILLSEGWPELAGEEGRIISAVSPDEDDVDPDSEWDVAPDCWGTSAAPVIGLHGGEYFAPSSDQLEPILPEGHQPCEESFKEELDNEFLKEKELVRA
jgi:hypothetical protein